MQESTKKAVVDTKEMLDKAGITEQRQALCQAAKQCFYNTSKFTLRDLRSRGSQQQLRQDFQAYLDSFSHDIQDILDSFKFRNQIPTRFQPYFPEKTAVGIRSVTFNLISARRDIQDFLFQAIARVKGSIHRQALAGPVTE